MAFWLEQQGYDVIYCSNTDLEMDPVLLDNAKVFLSVGHDEYWSRPMFEAALKARDRGLSLAFFSGDTMWSRDSHLRELGDGLSVSCLRPQA